MPHMAPEWNIRALTGKWFSNAPKRSVHVSINLELFIKFLVLHDTSSTYPSSTVRPAAWHTTQPSSHKEPIVSIEKVLYHAQALVDKAHIVCPYANATRNNIDMRLSLA